MASCRPWLCMTMSENERLVDPFCPCAPVLPEHMQMTLGKVRTEGAKSCVVGTAL